MHDKQQVFRFLVVGGLNTLVGFGVYSLFALTPLPTWLVLIATNVITLSFNFVTTGGLVFRQVKLRLIPRFLVGYGVVFCIYLGLIHMISPMVGGRIWAMAIVILPMAALTYLIQLLYVFRVPKS